MILYCAVEGYNDIESNDYVVTGLFVDDRLYESLIERPARRIAFL